MIFYTFGTSNANYYTKGRLLYKMPTIIQKADFYTKGRLLYKRPTIIQKTDYSANYYTKWPTIISCPVIFKVDVFKSSKINTLYDLDVVYVLLTVYICVVCS